jgi:hypothetical protein
MNNLTDLQEWNRWAEEGKTVIETLTELNNRYRKLEGELNEAKADADALAEAVEIMRVGICSAAMPNATEREIASDAVKQASEVLKTYRNKYQ